MSATDADLEENGEVMFRLSNTTNFVIDPVTGVVSSLRAFDFEVEQSLSLEIIAYDNVSSPLTDSALLTIYITDINDNTPFFEDFPVNVSFPEDTGLGTLIASIIAQDNDSMVNAEVSVLVYFHHSMYVLYAVNVSQCTGSMAPMAGVENGSQE